MNLSMRVSSLPQFQSPELREFALKKLGKVEEIASKRPLRTIKLTLEQQKYRSEAKLGYLISGNQKHLKAVSKTPQGAIQKLKWRFAETLKRASKLQHQHRKEIRQLKKGLESGY